MYNISFNPRPTYIPGTDLARDVRYDLNGGMGSPPVDTRLYSVGSVVTTPFFMTNMSTEGYFINGWRVTLDGVVTNIPPGKSFLMPAHSVTLLANWGPGVLRYIQRTEYLVGTGAKDQNWFIRYKFLSEGDVPFQQEAMDTSYPTSITRYVGRKKLSFWKKVTPAGSMLIEFIAADGTIDNNGGNGYLVLSNSATIYNGNIYNY
jgi:hypothetical protein